jgi:HAD superfamily hydrolase (TIGR01549 family)
VTTLRPTPDPPRPISVAAVCFDFDGTLTAHGAIDFQAIRAAVGVPEDTFILEHLATLAEHERGEALATVERFESEAAARSRPGAGVEQAVVALRSLGLPLGIVTRNGWAAVQRALQNFLRVTLSDFDVVVTRDDGLPTKPAPDQLLAACERLGVEPAETMMVGDFRLDVESGRAAGAITVYVYDEANTGQHPVDGCDFVIDSLRELPGIVQPRLADAAG